MKVSESQLWRNFVFHKRIGNSTILPDFSYCGYKYSDEELPRNYNWPVYLVDDYGGKPNTKDFCDEALLKAINAAASTGGGGIIQFSAGSYYIGVGNNERDVIKIHHSNVIIRGKGSNETLLFIHGCKPVNSLCNIIFEPNLKPTKKLGTLAGPVNRGSFQIKVNSVLNFKVDHDIIIRTMSPKFSANYFRPYEVNKRFTRLYKKGLIVNENHLIKTIDHKTKILTLYEPVMIDIDKDSFLYFEIREHTTLRNCGFEDLK
jgi:hypothetical protein